MCLFAMCRSSLVWCLLGSLVQVLYQFIFLLLNIKHSLYILGNSTLSDVSFENIISKSVASLFLFSTVFCRSRSLYFNELSLLILSFMNHALGVESKKLSPTPRSSRFSAM